MIKNISLNLLASVSILFISALVAFAIIATTNAEANSEIDIIYPITELGNCENKSECKSYCDNINHMNECMAFAEKHNLMDKKEIKEAQEFIKKGIRKGPGECTTYAECENYCEDVNNIEECLAFAEEHNMIPEKELKEAKQVAKALKEGAKLPGNCTDKHSCENYCEDVNNIEECVAFAEKAGFMSKKEIEEVKRILPLMKSGQMPGGCTSKEQCEAYCEDENNFNECIIFAEKAGFMTQEEVEMVKKTGGKGPGGCKGREECETFCEDLENQEICFAFAQEHGLIPEEDLANMREGAKKIKEGIRQAGPEVISCLERNIGPNVINEINNNTFSPSRKSGEVMKNCFEQYMERPNFPPEVEGCIIQVYGNDAIDKIMKDKIEYNEIERKIGPCVSEIMKSKFNEREKHRNDDFMKGGFEENLGEGFDNIDDIEEEYKEQFREEKDKIENGIESNFDNIDDDFLRTEPKINNSQFDFPPQADNCLIKLYGNDYKQKILSGEISSDSLHNSVTNCTEENMRFQQPSAVFKSLREKPLNRIK